jgi:hypothetical protein
MEAASPFVRVIARSVLVFASIVNLHNVLLLYSWFGGLFAPHDCNPFLRTRIGLQLLLGVSILAMLQTTTYTGNVACVLANTLSYLAPIECLALLIVLK